MRTTLSKKASYFSGLAILALMIGCGKAVEAPVGESKPQSEVKNPTPTGGGSLEAKAEPQRSPEAPPSTLKDSEKPATSATTRALSDLKKGVNPAEDYRSNFTKADVERVTLYHLFTQRKISTEQTLQRILADNDFNRTTLIFADCYNEDKARGSLSPEAVANFRLLGERVGGSVYLMNENAAASSSRTTAGFVTLGAVAGGALGLYKLPKAYVTEYVAERRAANTAIASAQGAYAREGAVAAEVVATPGRIPVIIEKSLVGAAAGAGVAYLGVQAANFWRYMANPNRNSFGSEALLDAAR